jgi:hypothetical protein
MTFEFFCEDGHLKLDYQDYLKEPELQAKVQDKRRFFLNLGLRIFSFDRDWLVQHPIQKGFVESLQREQQMNPVRFYLPNCANLSGFDSQAHNFINDVDHVYTGMLAGNRFGKSTVAFIKALLAYGVIPCDPNWEVFKDHGVTYREWTGPKEIAVCSINWVNITDTVWPQIARAWLPEDQLGNKIRWNPPKQTAFSVSLTCGSVIHFKCARQPQSAFESQALDGCVWDEQGMEANFDGMDFRMKTRRQYSKDEDGYEFLTSGFHICGATPHKVDGRADTGGGTWFEALYNKTETKGLSVAFYSGDIMNDVPDWIYPEREKISVLNALKEAEAVNNKKQARAIRSRLFGEFETTGGMVYDEWDDEMHIIDSFSPPSHWCAFRCMDHGRTNPTACIWVSVSPEGDFFAYREFVGADATITDNVQKIVQMSGNELKYVGEQATSAGLLTRYREIMGSEGEQYMFDVIDGRSFKSPDLNSRANVGELYRIAGLHRMQPAPIQSVEATIPVIKEYLRIDPERQHYVTKKQGAPRLYIMRSCPQLIKDVKAYRNREDKSRTGVVSEKPHSKNDHTLDAIRYGFMKNPRYMASKTYKGKEVKVEKQRTWWIDDSDLETPSERRKGRDRFTGH